MKEVEVAELGCRKCGLVHLGCVGHNISGFPCGRKRMKFLTICPDHGGDAPNNQIASIRRYQYSKAKQIMKSYGTPIDVSPQQALLDEVRRTAGHVAWLQEIVGDLDQEDMVFGMSKREIINASEYTGVDETYEAKVNVWITLYQSERKHLAYVCKAAVSAGVAEAQVRLAQGQANLVVAALKRIFEDLHLTDAQRAMIPSVVPQHLRALGSMQQQTNFSFPTTIEHEA